MYQLTIALALIYACVGDHVAGFADSVIYSFRTPIDTSKFLTLLEPLAKYVQEQEQDITFTFRPFVSTDNLSVLILERFIDKAAHDGPHSNSSVHLAFKSEVETWNASTSAITRKLHIDLQEASLGNFIRNSSASIAVSGFADSVLYAFKDARSRNQFMSFISPLASYVRDQEDAITLTFRPFLSTDGSTSVFIMERFVDKQAHDGPHFNSSAHQDFLQEIAKWNASFQTIVGKTHWYWQELDLGVLNRSIDDIALMQSDKDHCECTGPCPKYGKWICHYANGTIDHKYEYGDESDCKANCHSKFDIVV